MESLLIEKYVKDWGMCEFINPMERLWEDGKGFYEYPEGEPPPISFVEFVSVYVNEDVLRKFDFEIILDENRY